MNTEERGGDDRRGEGKDTQKKFDKFSIADNISYSGTVVPECCKDDYQSQWKKPEIRPPLHKNGQTDHHLTLHG